MFVIPSFKHNRTQIVDIPKPSALFARAGSRMGSKYSGDDFLRDMSKIDTAAKVMADAAKIAQETPDAELGITNPKS